MRRGPGWVGERLVAGPRRVGSRPAVRPWPAVGQLAQGSLRCAGRAGAPHPPGAPPVPGSVLPEPPGL